MEPGYVVAEKSGLTVVAVAPNVETSKIRGMVGRAVENVESQVRLPRMLEAAKIMHACFKLLEPKLAAISFQDSPRPTGIAMLALPRFIESLASDYDPFPAIVAAQAVGRAVDPAKYRVVGAKALCVACTGGRASGTLEGELKKKYSNIQGGVPIRLNPYGERVMAVGGLKMEEDVELI